MRIVWALGWIVLAGTALAQSPHDREWQKLEKQIARGEHEFVELVLVRYGEAGLPLLLQALAVRDDAVRESAASELRKLAGRSGDSATLRAAMPQLRGALRDPDGAVVVGIAGALESLDEPRGALAEARRDVLRSPDSRAWVRFEAARGLIGEDPPAALLPDLLAFLFESVSANEDGSWDVDTGIVENHDLAMQALTRLVEQGDRGLIAPLQSELDTAHPVVPSLLRLLAHFDPDPDAWAGTLLRATRSPADTVREVAWELLGEARTPEQLDVWLPVALAALDDPAAREDALDAISDLRGVRVEGFERIAALMLDRGLEADLREDAVEVLYDASDDNLSRGDAAAKAQARRISQDAWRRLLATEPDGELLQAADDKLPYLGLSSLEVGTLALEAAERNPDPAAQAVLLKSVAWAGSPARPLLARVRPFAERAEPAVREAATAALQALDPAWSVRESVAARQAGALATAPARAAGGGVPTLGRDAARALLARRKLAVGFPGLYEAIRRADPEAVAAQIDAGVAVNTAGKLAPSVDFSITPLQAVVDYCHITELVPAPKLLAMAEALLARGGDPSLRGSRDRSALENAIDVQCPAPLVDLLAGG
jgi:hypothetical protein